MSMKLVRLINFCLICTLLPATLAFSQAVQEQPPSGDSSPIIVQEDSPQGTLDYGESGGGMMGASDCSCFTDSSKPCYAGMQSLRTRKPETYQRMESECSGYISEVISRAAGKSGEVEAAASSSGQTAKHRYWLGAEMADTTTLRAADIVKLGEALFDKPLDNCFDYALLGMCFTYYGGGFSKSPYVEYRWPEQATEGVKDRAMTAYLTDTLAKAKGKAVEDFLQTSKNKLATLGWDQYRKIIKPGLGMLNITAPRDPSSTGSNDAVELALDMTIGSSSTSGITGLIPGVSAIESAVDTVSGEDDGFSNRAVNVGGPGFLRTEYRVQRLGLLMGKLEDMIKDLQLPFVWEGFCHDRKEDANNDSTTCSDGCYWSEDEGQDTSRFALEGTNANAEGMEQKSQAPLACAEYYKTIGNSDLRTPEDLFSVPGASSASGDMTKYCSTGNQGNEFALLNSVNSLDRRTATEQAVLRGTDAPGSEAGDWGLYEYIDEFRGGENKDHDDRVQWTNDKVMEEENGAHTCVKLTPETMHYARDFTLEERDTDTLNKSEDYGGDGETDPFWMVAHQWHRFRCCKDLICVGNKCDKKIKE